MTVGHNKLWFLSPVNNFFQTSLMVWPHNRIWGPMVGSIPFWHPNYSDIYLKKTFTSSSTLVRKHHMLRFKDHLSILAKKSCKLIYFRMQSLIYEPAEIKWIYLCFSSHWYIVSRWEILSFEFHLNIITMFPKLSNYQWYR